MNRELKILLALLAAFGAAYYLPASQPRFQGAVISALDLLHWYAREHVLFCLVPAFFIAGAIGVFVRQNAVMRYFGPAAHKGLSYGVASVSGTVLAVCSCTVLPLFGSIYLRGAGLGPAIAFLYSGPAINVLAIALTARILGWQLGLARAVGAISFSVVIGLLMHLLFRKEEAARHAEAQGGIVMAPEDGRHRPLWQTALFFATLAGILILATWARPLNSECCVLYFVYNWKWPLTAGLAELLAVELWAFFYVRWSWLAPASLAVAALALAFPGRPLLPFIAGTAALALFTFKSTGEMREWGEQTWAFAKQITPLLFGGVLAAGFFLGSPHAPDSGMIPNRWIEALLGDSPRVFWNMAAAPGAALPGWLTAVWPVWTNFFVSVVGALMYFATLTEVPIVRGLMDSGMGQGPALALLLAGPALSLPSMLVINSILGPKKTITYVALVVVMATMTGIVFGVVTKTHGM